MQSTGASALGALDSAHVRPSADGNAHLSPLSILHVLAPGEAGGLESVVHMLARGHRDHGHMVRVAAVLDDGVREHPYVRGLIEAGVETTSLAIPARAYLRERSWIVELCRRYQPTVVHTHGFRPDVVDATVARRCGVATVTTVHGRTGGGWKVRLYERVQRVAFRYFDAVAAVSRPLAEELAASGVRRDRLHVLPNAYTARAPVKDRATARRQLGLAEDGFVVGWVGRLSREKGVDTLLDALARLLDLPWRVSVFGDGPEREALGARAERLRLGDRMTWHGLVSDAASLFRAFDVFVLSSRTEGCPVVLFEAMDAGVPMVATQVGGVPDVVSPREALLVPPNDPVALANAIAAIYHDRTHAAGRALAAHQRLVAEFGPAPWLARYDALYRQVQRRMNGGAR